MHFPAQLLLVGGASERGFDEGWSFVEKFCGMQTDKTVFGFSFCSEKTEVLMEGGASERFWLRAGLEKIVWIKGRASEACFDVKRLNLVAVSKNCKCFNSFHGTQQSAYTRLYSFFFLIIITHYSLWVNFRPVGALMCAEINQRKHYTCSRLAAVYKYLHYSWSDGLVLLHIKPGRTVPVFITV